MLENFKPLEFVVMIVIGGLMMFIIRRFPKMMAGVPFVAPKALKDVLDAARPDDVLVIDVRTPDEFRGGHVAGALNLPLGDLNNRVRELSEELKAYADHPVYLMCRTSNRASSAARTLKDAGLKNLKVVDGGMMKWARAGLPVETR